LNAIREPRFYVLQVKLFQNKVSSCFRSVFLTLGLHLAHNESAQFLFASATKSKHHKAF